MEVKNIPLLDLVEREQEFRNYLEKQIIPDPPNDLLHYDENGIFVCKPGHLLTIYEKRILYEHSYLRAEKYDSPEHQEELKKIQAKSDNQTKVPRNIQNPNYDILMNYYEKIVTAPTLQRAIKELDRMHKFMNSFGLIRKFQYKPMFLETTLPHLDPRFFEKEEDLPLFLNYLLTKVRNRLAQQEFQCLLTLTNKMFDDQSTHEALYYLRDIREKPDEYQSVANQLKDAIDHQPDYQLNPPNQPNFDELDAKIERDRKNKKLKDEEKTEDWILIKQPRDYKNVADFFNDLYLSLT